MKKELLSADFGQSAGVIRRLNGGNLGPMLSNGYSNGGKFIEEFAELEIPITRLHDAPLGNKGMRLVDIQHIFGNWKADAQNPDNYYFIQTDDYLRTIRAGGSDILFRLGTSIEHSLNNYFAFPPDDYEKWTDICINIIRHYNEGWNNGFSWDIRYWEIWNEPDVVKKMWNSSIEEYSRFYEVAARRIKARFPNIKIGGPVLARVRPGSNDENARIFLGYCRDHQVPLDFFSWHRYAGDLDEIISEPAGVRALLDEYGFPDAELHLTEWHYWFKGFTKEAYCDMIDGIPGINAAVFATALLTAWQDSPLTMGYHYTIGELSNAWGAWSYGEPLKLFYTLKTFTRIARCRERVKTETGNHNCQILAGIGESGKRSVLISDFKSGADTLELHLRGAENARFHLVRIDFDHDWAESECSAGADGTLILPGTDPGKSQVFLLEEL